MAAENFKVKKGLEVGTGITANSDGVNVTGIVTATQFKGDGSGLTGVTASGSGVIVKDEGSTVGTAATINFVGGGVAATLSAGIATVTINSGTTVINNNGNNKLITGSGSPNTLEAESGLTYDGTYFNHIGSGFKQLKIDTSTSNSASLLLKNSSGNFTVNTINNAGNRNFTVYDGTAASTRFSINQNGTVGITSGLNVTGVSTFASAIDANGDLDVDGQTELDDLNVSGIATGTIFKVPDATNVNGATNHIAIGDNSDLKLYHDNNGDAQIFNSTGHLTIVNNTAGRIINLQPKSGANGVIARYEGAAELYHNGNLKLTTTINGIEVPDLNVTGVGTVGRLETNGVSFGTNSTTFAAKFLDDAVINVGTNNDLKIYHDDGNGLTYIRNDGTGPLDIRSINDINIRDGNDGDLFIECKESEGVKLHYEGNEKLEVTNHGAIVTGVCTATSFSGSGAGLTNIPSAQLSGALPSLDGSALTGVTASGTGIIIQHDGSNVGTAGTINFSTNLDVSPISAGIVTVTASGGGGGVSLANGVDNRVVTATGAAALNGETNLTWDGTTLAVVSQQTVSGSVVVGSGVTIDASGINAVGTAVTAGRFHADGGSFRTQIGSGNQGFYMYNGASTHLAINWSSSASRNQFRGSAAGNNPLWFEDFSYIRVSPKSAYVQLDYGESPKLVTDIAGVKITGICTATSFSGSGIGLTSLNADNLGSGEIPNGRFPTTLPAVSGANLTALNASEITSGTLPIARIADDAINADKLNNTGVSAGSYTNASITVDAQGRLTSASTGSSGITTAPSNITATWSIGGNSGSGYQFTGPGQDGSEGNPDIYLVRGQKYRFVNTTGTGHPFEFRNEANNADYTDGITGSQSGTQEFNVQHDAPAALKYRCTIHTSSMLGNIYIVGQHLANGGNDRILTATSAYGMNAEANLQFDGTNLFMPNELRHLGDPDTKMGFDTNTIKFETAGSQRLLIDSNGKVKIGSGTASLALLHIEPTLYGINLQNDSNNKSRILFSKNSAGNDSRAWIEGNGELNGYISLAAGDSERLHIDSDEATFDGIINQGTAGGDIRHVVKSFGPAFLGNSSTADLTLDAGQGGGTLTVHAFRTSNNDLSRTSIFGFQLRGTGTASVGTTIYNQTGSAGDASFSVTAIAQGIRFTNNAGATVKYSVTFDLTGDL